MQIKDRQDFCCTKNSFHQPIVCLFPAQLLYELLTRIQYGKSVSSHQIPKPSSLHIYQHPLYSCTIFHTILAKISAAKDVYNTRHLLPPQLGRRPGGDRGAPARILLGDVPGSGRYCEGRDEEEHGKRTQKWRLSDALAVSRLLC